MAALVGFSRVLSVAANNCLRRVSPGSFCRLLTPAPRLCEQPKAGLRSYLPWMPKIPEHQVEIRDTTEEDVELTKEVIQKVNQQIATNSTGRLFAIVHVCGKQFKITENDIIIIQGDWPPNVGDKLMLEKVLLVGSTDFTLVGRPILGKEVCVVEATVVEKTISHTKTRFQMKKRKQYRRINFTRVHHTMLRINSINVAQDISRKNAVEGLNRIY